jgi:putative oxidoreductase
MKILVLICRILLGLLFVVFGLNGFFHFIPMAGPTPGSPLAIWIGVMMDSGWMHVINAVQIIGGLLVLSGAVLPLGIILLCPVTFNILMFHLLLAGGHGMGYGLATGVFEVVLIYYYRPYFNGIFSTKAEPVYTRTV